MKKISIIIIMAMIITLTGCRNNIESDNRDITFEDAIKQIQNTNSIIIYNRQIDPKTDKISLTLIGTIIDDEVDEIITTLINSSEWSDNVINQFVPSNEFQLYDKGNNEIAKFRFYGDSVSELVFKKKTFFLNNYDSNILNKIIENSKNE